MNVRRPEVQIESCDDMAVDPRNCFDLREFTTAGYSRGRSLATFVAWWIVSHTLVQPWYGNSRLRVALLRLFGAKIGDNVLIRARVRVHLPWKLVVDDSVWLGEGVWLLNLEKVIIEENVCLSQEVFVCTGGHDRFDPGFRYKNGPIRIGTGSWLGARAVVMPGSVLPAGEFLRASEVWPLRRTNE
jgi:putative colanic acid biosynthesis acetyltransferase WcaF